MIHAIETTGLSRRFGRAVALDGLTLQIPAGTVFALIGPNGAGKTTTLKLLMNLLRPTGGSARVLGTDSRRLGARELQRVGYVSENQRLPDWMTVRQLLDFCKAFYPAWDDELASRLERVLGLTSRKPLRTLSRGTRMKAVLLSSLAYRPELLVLDEPFTGLDPFVRDELIRTLLDGAIDTPGTVLISSHDLDDVERLANWVGFLLDGRLLFAEPVGALLARFQQVEIVSPGPIPVTTITPPHWIVQAATERTRRFVDTQHTAPDAHAVISAAFPSAAIRVSPLPLRDIFVTLAGQAAAARREAS